MNIKEIVFKDKKGASQCQRVLKNKISWPGEECSRQRQCMYVQSAKQSIIFKKSKKLPWELNLVRKRMHYKIMASLVAQVKGDYVIPLKVFEQDKQLIKSSFGDHLSCFRELNWKAHKYMFKDYFNSDGERWWQHKLQW